MKNILYSFLLLLTIGANAQIGIGKAKPDPTAIIDLSSTKKGFLVPRMTTAQREAIGNPAAGLQVYDTDTNSLWYFNGTDWKAISTMSDASTTAKGILKLAGDLSGSADAPIVGVDKINSTKILDNTITNNDLSNGTGGIYKGDGSLSGDTEVTGGTSTLAFTSTKTNGFSVDGPTFSVDALNDIVGIGTVAPNTKALLDLTSTTKGILPPRMTTVQRNLIAPTTTTAGLTIYNTDTNSLEVFDGTKWYSTDKATPLGTITALNCDSATLSAPLTKNVAATGITLTIPYTGGNAGTFDAQIITSTGITGLTATLTKGSFANGASVIGFALSGTPSTSGITSFSFNLGGQSCIVNLTINGVIGGITCSGGAQTGTLNNGTAATGVSNTVAYTGGDGGPYAAQSIPSTGVTGLTATLPAGNFLSGAGNLNYTITGTPVGVGTASFAIAIGGKSCTLTRTVTQTLTTLDCAGAAHNGTLNNGIAASGVTTVLSYTGGDGSPYAVQNINSTGVTGLIAQLPAGNLATGNGTLTYTISGTPSGSGTASFAITIGGKSCSFSRTVIPMPATITLGDAYGYFITSVLDSDYIPYTAPSVVATTATTAPADNIPDLTLNVQGTLTPTGVTIRIPYTVVTQATTLPAYKQTITIPAYLTQDGIARDVEFLYPSQSKAIGSGFINATLRTAAGTLNIKQLDVQNGIGNNYLGVLLANFTYPKNNSGSTSNFELRAIAPIPDRNSTDSDHRFYYSPVYALDGKVWLANNLGADYANHTKTGVFNPAKQATATNEFNAYGSLYQWGRYSDGHELINWTGVTTGTMNGTTTTLSNSSTAPDKLFIKLNITPYDWLTTKNDDLWQGASGINNPCPLGYRIPTDVELTAVVNAEKIDISSSAVSSSLHYTVPGYRDNSNGALTSSGSNGYYWSNTVNGDNIKIRFFNSLSTYSNNLFRIYGFSVRCIKD